MTDLAFETVPVPATTRSPKPNPWDGKFPSDSNAILVKLDGVDAESKDVARLVAQARSAAQRVDRTARSIAETKSEGNGKARKTWTELRVWTVPRIKRERKS